MSYLTSISDEALKQAVKNVLEKGRVAKQNAKLVMQYLLI